VPMTKNAAVF